jgi:hypothetical protein
MGLGRRFFLSTIKKEVGLPFISEWRTTNTSSGSSNSDQVKLPLISTGTYNFVVNWGDGNSDTITTWNQAETTHTYASSGDYTITITGVCIGWAFANIGDRLKILDISSWGILEFLTQTNTNFGFFRGCTNLNITATDPLNFQSMGCTAIAGMFSLCTNLVGNSSFNDWTTTGITNLANIFGVASNFNQPLGNWDVSAVTNFNSCFQDTLFNQNIGSWNVGSGQIFAAMFRRCPFNNGGSDSIKDWNMSSATTLGSSGLGMFAESACTFNQPIGSWNVSNVTSFNSVFRNNPNFNQNIGAWDVSKASDFALFMSGKTAANYSAANLDSIYNGWSALTFVNTGLTISFGTIKYTAAGQAGRDILTDPPNNWTITDDGI